MRNLFEAYMDTLGMPALGFPDSVFHRLLIAIQRALFSPNIRAVLPRALSVHRTPTTDADILVTHTANGWKWETNGACKTNEELLRIQSGALFGLIRKGEGHPHMFSLWCDAEQKRVHGFMPCISWKQWSETMQTMVATLWGPGWELQLESFTPRAGPDCRCIFWSTHYAMLRFEGHLHVSAMQVIKDSDIEGLKDRFRDLVSMHGDQESAGLHLYSM